MILIKVLAPGVDLFFITPTVIAEDRWTTHAPSTATWRHLTLCAGHPEPGCWFSEDNDDNLRAIAVCRACPVRSECLTFAVTTGQSQGVWGGTMPSERRHLLRTNSRAL